SHRRQPFQIIAVDIFHYRIAVGKMADHPTFGGTKPAQYGHQLCGLVQTFVFWKAPDFLSPKNVAFFLYLPLYIFRGHFNDLQTVYITFIGSISPGKKPMAAQNDAPDTGILIETSLQLEPQIKTGTLPWHPSHGIPPN